MPTRIHASTPSIWKKSARPACSRRWANISTSRFIPAARPNSPCDRRLSQGVAMSKGPIVSNELAQKFATEKDTPYERWVRSQGLDIQPAMYVRQLRTIKLKPWAERGGSAVFLNHESTRTT